MRSALIECRLNDVFQGQDRTSAPQAPGGRSILLFPRQFQCGFEECLKALRVGTLLVLRNAPAAPPSVRARLASPCCAASTANPSIASMHAVAVFERLADSERFSEPTVCGSIVMLLTREIAQVGARSRRAPLVRVLSENRQAFLI